MLSATPVNNKMDDLKNQLAFITEDNDKALSQSADIKSISSTLRKAKSIFNKWGDLEEDEKTTERLLYMLDFDYFKLLDSLTIARSRKHIDKYYNSSDIGQFPKRLKPENIKEDSDILGKFHSLEHFNSIFNNEPANYFVYDSNKLDQIRSFATSNTIEIMIINIDAFRKNFDNPTKENLSNIIHRPQDKLNGQKHIDLIKETNPIVIIDEPQSVDTTDKSKEDIK